MYESIIHAYETAEQNSPSRRFSYEKLPESSNSQNLELSAFGNQFPKFTDPPMALIKKEEILKNSSEQLKVAKCRLK